jgi:hypothetical protein
MILASFHHQNNITIYATKYAPNLKQTTTAKLWRFALGQHFVNDIETSNVELADDTMTTTQNSSIAFGASEAINTQTPKPG